MGGLFFGTISDEVQVFFSVLSTSKTFAPFLCDHCNVNGIAMGAVFWCSVHTGMMDEGKPNRIASHCINKKKERKKKANWVMKSLQY